VDTFGKPKSVTIDPNGTVLRWSPSMRVAVAIKRGDQFVAISEYSDAIKEYQKALDVNRSSSLAHYRVGAVFMLQNSFQSAANEFRESLNGDLTPKWTEVWAHIKLGNIFDVSGQRDRAVNEYNHAIRTKDNTEGAQEEAAKYLKTPFERKRNGV
jgi:tetratricopeptide (TPR) repeat protein